MKFELKTTCDFPEVWENRARGADDMSCLPQPVKKVGHYRADHNGFCWYGRYFPCNEHLKTTELAAELVNVCTYLLEELFAGEEGYEKLCSFCTQNPQACIDEEGGEYSFFITGSHANFWIKMITRKKDYNLYVNAFSK